MGQEPDRSSLAKRSKSVRRVKLPLDLLQTGTDSYQHYDRQDRQGEENQ
jgi:hypothetical protein